MKSVIETRQESALASDEPKPKRKAMNHFVKCWPDHFEKIFDGTKPFELRKNDRDYRVGDQVIIQEWIPETETYTSRVVVWQIAYLIEDPNWLQPGYCCFGPSIGKINQEAITIIEECEDLLSYGSFATIRRHSPIHHKIQQFLERNRKP